MTLGDYNVLREWKMQGYIYWSPKDVFEKSYHPTTGLTFGLALEALKQGHCVARAGWNGKNMFIYLNKGSHHFAEVSTPGFTHIEGVKRELFELGDTGTITRLPNINMRAATGSTVTGWLASQTDMLAEDWVDLDVEIAPPSA